MKKIMLALCIASLFGVGCEKKASDEAAQTAAQTTSAAPRHIDTNREAFKAAGRAAKEIEAREAEHNAAADEAMKAGQ